ncbi:MAG: PIN domain-containing protein [Gemmatimonadota bacterium]
MAGLIYLDTHVVAWLYGLGATALSAAAAEAIDEADDLRCSPMVRLELQYLYEVGRTTEPALTVIDALQTSIGLLVCDAPFGAVVREAEPYSWTRDPFDRLIVAQAALRSAILVTKDETLHRQYERAVW